MPDVTVWPIPVYFFKLPTMLPRASYVRAPDWPTPVRYSIAVTAAVAAAAARSMLSLWGDSLPYLTFVPAIVLSAWAGGFWPGIVTTALGAVFATYFWLAPFYSFQLSTVADLISLCSSAAIGALISALSESDVPRAPPTRRAAPQHRRRLRRVRSELALSLRERPRRGIAPATGFVDGRQDDLGDVSRYRRHRDRDPAAACGGRQ